MKIILAYILFWLGDIISYTLHYNFLVKPFYPVYQKLMLWSSNLDVHGKIWKDVGK